MMRLTEEIVLLLLDRQSGDFQHSLPAHARDFVIGGAVLMDLALERRTDSDPDRLFLLDSTPVNDDLLDPTLSDIAEEAETRDARFWIERTAARAEGIRDRAISRLIDRGILNPEENGLLFLSRRVLRLHRYPPIDGKTLADIESRVMRALFSDDIPETRDILIIALSAAAGVLESILSKEELAEASERIDFLSRLELIGRVIGDGIRTIEPPAPVVKKARPFEEIPEIPGLPVAGNAFQMAGDVREFLTAGYVKYGPIFRVRAFNQRFVALAGPEANVFVQKISATHLRSYEPYREFCAFLGAHRALLNMDGPEHLRIRKLLVKGYSPKTLETHFDEAHGATRDLVAAWPANKPMAIQRAMQELIAEQIGLVCTGVSPRGYADDLIRFLGAAVTIHITRRWPRQMERLPRFRRARRRVEELYEKIMAAHEPDRRLGEEPDFVDDLLEVNRTDPQFLPETDLLANVVAPFLVGIDTSASVCAFMLYSLLSHPELMERVREEVDEMFDRGPPTPEALSELDVTHRVAMETLRMYPIIPALTRIVSNSFEFEGYRVPAGEEVLLGTTVAHHLPKYFPDPGKFDIERYSQSPPQHRQPGCYAPFGLGRHRCLGAGFSEVQIALTMATIVREADLVLDRPERPLKIKIVPAAHPDASTRFRLLRRRGRAAPQ